jgi:hypothetical protein
MPSRGICWGTVVSWSLLETPAMTLCSTHPIGRHSYSRRHAQRQLECSACGSDMDDIDYMDYMGYTGYMDSLRRLPTGVRPAGRSGAPVTLAVAAGGSR